MYKFFYIITDIIRTEKWFAVSNKKLLFENHNKRSCEFERNHGRFTLTILFIEDEENAIC